MPAKRKAAHHRGTYQARAKRVTDAAYANPSTRCWRCRRTLAQVQQRKPRARWTAGHVIAGQVGGDLEPECSPCNYGHGARLGNRMRRLARRPPPPPMRQSRRW